MNNYENSKKPRRVASVIYLLVMAVILGGLICRNNKKNCPKWHRKSHPCLWKRLLFFLIPRFQIKGGLLSLIPDQHSGLAECRTIQSISRLINQPRRHEFTKKPKAKTSCSSWFYTLRNVTNNLDKMLLSWEGFSAKNAAKAAPTKM